MADIGMLYGDMYLRNAWPIILQNDINMNAELEALKDRTVQYLFRINAQPIVIGNNTSIIRFMPEVFTSTHVVLGTMLNFYTDSVKTLTLGIKLNGYLVANINYPVSAGWNLVAFPYFVPSLGRGINVIEVIGAVNNGTVTIEPNSLNAYLQARSILGASDLPPAVNVFEEIPWVVINDDNAGVTATALITIVEHVVVGETVAYYDVCSSQVAVNVLIELS